ncbi:hypothetical protein [Paenibacillus sp. JCM 10914]|uniref:hypothetical protein n=1 Tax=Paenibacillus sp. JCM 10914 TaxID=1236974 RepID=UPI000A82E2DE|nr:hypothetical protein [Paenibacillus sp. JCM 10914]
MASVDFMTSFKQIEAKMVQRLPRPVRPFETADRGMNACQRKDRIMYPGFDE